MKHLMIIFCAILFLASCGPTVKPLYTWGKYEDASYSYLKKNDEKSTQQLIEAYQKIIDEQKGSRKTVPPGIYADYGFILIQTGKTKEGKALLEKEIALYPESKVFVERILKLIEK
jgi:hypothetical protein